MAATATAGTKKKKKKKKKQSLEKRLEHLQRRLKTKNARHSNKNRAGAEILRLQRATDEEGIITNNGGNKTQDDQTTASETIPRREGKAVADDDVGDVGSKEDEPAGSRKGKENRVWWPNAEAFDYVVNRVPSPYRGVPDDELAKQCEAAQALQMETRALLDEIYRSDMNMREQLIRKGYYEYNEDWLEADKEE